MSYLHSEAFRESEFDSKWIPSSTFIILCVLHKMNCELKPPQSQPACLFTLKPVKSYIFISFICCDKLQKIIFRQSKSHFYHSSNQSKNLSNCDIQSN